jgi:hypothetical protein
MNGDWEKILVICCGITWLFSVIALLAIGAVAAVTSLL